MALTAAQFVALKAKIKAELARRDKNGPVSQYAGASYDFTVTPQKDNPILVEHGKKTIDLALRIADVSKLATVVSGDLIPTGIDTLGDTITKWSKEIDTTTAKATSSCRAACTGLCANACVTTCMSGCSIGCKGCTGCSGTCLTSCTGMCYNGCYGCGNSCSGSCNTGCSGCSSGCKDRCLSSCKSGCDTSCSGGCGQSCSGTAKSPGVIN